jgi:hypothetical protein
MVRVECYAGYKADERPFRFFAEGREYYIQKLLNRWSSPGVDGFRVRTPHGVFNLRHNLIDDTWTAQACPGMS